MKHAAKKHIYAKPVCCILAVLVFAAALIAIVSTIANPGPFSAIESALHNNKTVLAFSSDAHVTQIANGTQDNDSAVRASQWIEAVETTQGQIEWMGFCGDCGNAGADSPSEYWKYAQHLMDEVEAKTRGIYTTGNHEYNPGDFDTGDSDAIAKYLRIGEAVSERNYSIFCLGASGWDQQFPEADIEALERYLTGKDKNKPIFILSHYPLHEASSRSTVNASKVITLLNEYPNVIFLWGHNHTVIDASGNPDSHYDAITTDAIDGMPITFTYAAAGCMCDSEYGPSSNHVNGKGLVAKVSTNGMDVTLQYCDKSGSALKEPVTISIP